MAIAAAVSPVVAEDHGRELGVHGDIDFCLREKILGARRVYLPS